MVIIIIMSIDITNKYQLRNCLIGPNIYQCESVCISMYINMSLYVTSNRRTTKPDVSYKSYNQCGNAARGCGIVRKFAYPLSKFVPERL